MTEFCICEQGDADKGIHMLLFLLPDKLREMIYEQIEAANDMHLSVYGREIAPLVKLDMDEFSESDVECLSCFTPQIVVEERLVNQ